MTVIIDRPLNGGTQVVHRFDNNFGASVVCHDSSYGHEEGLFELAVLTFASEANYYELTYDTEITNDVLGHLSEEDVESLLKRVEEIGSKETRYSIIKLQEALETTYKRISNSEEERDNLEQRIVDNKAYREEQYQCAKDLESTISKLKGETK